MDAAPSSETSSAVEDFKQLPMMNSRTACRKLDEEEDECDGDEDIVTAAGRGAFRIDGEGGKDQRRDGKAVEGKRQRNLTECADDQKCWRCFILGKTLSFLVLMWL